MASKIQWSDIWASQGNVLATELNALANGSRSAAGTAVDNGANTDQYGKLELTVTFAVAPDAGGYVGIYAVTALNGTDYEDGSDTVDPGLHRLICTIPVKAVTTAQRVASQIINLEPAPTKFLLVNRTGQDFPSSGSILKLYSANDEIQ